MKNPFKELTKFEACLWSISTAIVILSFILSPQKDIMTLIASVVGTTSLIFIAKGLVIGQVLMVFFFTSLRGDFVFFSILRRDDYISWYVNADGYIVSSILD